MKRYSVFSTFQGEIHSRLNMSLKETFDDLYGYCFYNLSYEALTDLMNMSNESKTSFIEEYDYAQDCDYIVVCSENNELERWYPYSSEELILWFNDKLERELKYKQHERV